jgi:autotransporter strand-loop-strand O-heptosyltransferase
MLVKILSNSLGDNIAAMPVIEKYRSDKQIDVYVIIKPEYVFLFDNSYPDLKFISDKTNLIFTEEKELEYDFTENIQYGYAKQLGYENWEYIRPKIIIEKKERPKLGKYVAISVHSTSQLKYWNHPLGREVQELSPNWTEICSRLRKKNLKPLILEKYETFGQSPYFNGLPKKSNSRINLSLEELVNYLDHCEFFMGLSSGNAWIAHALGKKVLMISNFTEDWNEFDLNCEDYIRVVNKNVCHGCWNKINIEHKFDSSDWYWCPKFKGTSREFECHKSITPDMVWEKVEKWVNECN